MRFAWSCERVPDEALPNTDGGRVFCWHVLRTVAAQGRIDEGSGRRSGRSFGTGTLPPDELGFRLGGIALRSVARLLGMAADLLAAVACLSIYALMHGDCGDRRLYVI